MREGNSSLVTGLPEAAEVSGLSSKEHLLWVRTFATVEELRVALQEFRRIDNETWIIERHDYKTPAQIRREQRGLVIKAARLRTKSAQKTLDRYNPLFVISWTFMVGRCRLKARPVMVPRSVSFSLWGM